MCIHTYTNTYIHTDICTYMHTQIHIYNIYAHMYIRSVHLSCIYTSPCTFIYRGKRESERKTDNDLFLEPVVFKGDMFSLVVGSLVALDSNMQGCHV